jgi:AraC family transcriptional regulator
MMERDGICNIAGTAKHYTHEPPSVGPLVRRALSHGVPRASMRSDDHVTMIVDDDYRVREALQRLLAASNLRAVAFGSAAEYFAYPKPDVPAYLILDVDLSVGNGLDLVRQMGDGNHRAVIFVASHGDVRSAVLAMSNERPIPRDSSEAPAGLQATATAAPDIDLHAAKMYIEGAAEAPGPDLAEAAPLAPANSRPRGGLAPWQAKRIRSYIEGKLDSSIRATDLAGVVQLSPSHFFRAFRKTFGESPLAYIMQRRIRRAQELMLASRISLSQVALECGMCDQAHFSRAFRRIVGTNPNAWRRQFPVDPAPDGSVVGQIPIRTAR